MGNRRRLTRTLASATALLLALSGCGSGDSEGADSTAPPTTAASREDVSTTTAWFGSGGQAPGQNTNQVPANFPDEVPVPEWAVVSVLDRSNDDMTLVMLTFTPPASPADAFAHLRELYLGANFEEVAQEEGLLGPTGTYRSGDWTVYVSVGGIEGETAASVVATDDPRKAQPITGG